jgi:hypothetical protein
VFSCSTLSPLEPELSRNALVTGFESKEMWAR